MKKITPLMVLAAATFLNTKAQNHLMTDAGYISAPAANIDYSKKTFTASTNHIPSDSTGTVKDHAYYIQKSKNQRTAGLVLLGAGLVASGFGLLIGTGNNASFDDTQTGVTIMGIGALSGIVSIPLMIMAHANRNKARLLLSSQKTGIGIPLKYGKELTGFTVSIPLGR